MNNAESIGADFPSPFPARWASDWGEDQYGLWMGFTLEGVNQRFRWIAPGSFAMGSPASEEGRFDNELLHDVTITEGYWLADTCCTRDLWSKLVAEKSIDESKLRLPMTRVSWNAVYEWIEMLNKRIPDLDARLPTEAEWEYACRADSTTAYWFGDKIDKTKVRFSENEPVSVASLPPNPWGLYEMHGNIFEWCQDWYGDYPDSDLVDPKGSKEGGDRVLRGGSWYFSALYARSASRFALHPDDAYSYIGFRLARGQ